MALCPLRRRGPARAVARGPTLRWRVGGATGGTTAVALRLATAPGVAGMAAGGSSPPPALPTPPPPHRGEQGPGGPAEDMSCLTGEQGGRGTRLLRAPLPSNPTPGPPAAGPGPLLTCSQPFSHMARGTRGRGRGRGRGPAPPPPRPPSRSSSGGTMASSWCAGGTARPPWCFRPAPSSVAWPKPSAPWPPSWDCSPGSCGSKRSWRERGTDDGTAVTGPRTSRCGSPPSTARAAPSSGPRGPLWAKPRSGGTPRASTRAPPGRTPAAAASRTRGAGTLTPCGGRRRASRCGRKSGLAAWSDGTIPLLDGSTARAAASPSSRESQPQAGTTPWGWTGGAVSGTTTPPASHPPTLGLRRRGGMWPTPSRPFSQWSPMCGGPSCRSRERFMPRHGGLMPSAALERAQSRTACTRSSRRPSASLGTGNGALPRVRSRLPCRAPVAGHRSPRHRPLCRPARPPLGGDQARLPDHGAAGLGSKVNLQACLAAPLTSLLERPDLRRTNLCGGWGLHLSPPPGRGRRNGSHPPPPQCWASPPLLLLRCGDIEPHPGPMRVVLASVTSLRLHWHTVGDWRADGVLISEPRLTGVAHQVMRAHAGASGWQAFLGGALGIPVGGASGMGQLGGWVSWYAKASRPGKFSPPKRAPRTEVDALAQTLRQSTRWCHVLGGLEGGADSPHA